MSFCLDRCCYNQPYWLASFTCFRCETMLSDVHTISLASLFSVFDNAKLTGYTHCTAIKLDWWLYVFQMQINVMWCTHYIIFRHHHSFLCLTTPDDATRPVDGQSNYRTVLCPSPPSSSSPSFSVFFGFSASVYPTIKRKYQ